MVTIRDFIRLDEMRSLKLIAGEGGLDKEIYRVGILDYEFTKSGVGYDMGWDGEFVLSSLLYARDEQDTLLNAVKRLHKFHAVCLAIRNVFRFSIDQEVIRFSNKNKFPIFIIDDNQLYFEDIINVFFRLEERSRQNDSKEKLLREILHGSFSEKEVKAKALEINYFFGNSYYCFFLKPVTTAGENRLNQLILHGLDKTLKKQGDSLIRYKSGAFYIHSIDPAEPAGIMADYWHQAMILDKAHFRTGISELQLFLQNVGDALRQSYYACCYAGIYGLGQAHFENIGIYKLLFLYANNPWQERFLTHIREPLREYDRENKSELWSTLMNYEQCDGNIKTLSALMNTHENTIRYRLKKIFNLFDKEVGNENFEMELLMAVKMSRILLFLRNDMESLE